MRGVCCVLLLLVAIPSAQARTLVSAAVVEVGADMNETADCSVGLDAQLCLVHYQDQGTSGLGDDVIASEKFVDTVSILVRNPAGDSESLTIEPSRFRLNHPFLRKVNETWIQANSSLPDAAKMFVTLESRPANYADRPWGIFVVVHTPAPLYLPGNNESIQYMSSGLCWDVCSAVRTNSTLYEVHQDYLQPFPDNVLLSRWGSDTFLAELMAPMTECWYGSTMPGGYCQFVYQGGRSASAGVELVTSLTPSVRLGYQFNRTIVATAPLTGPASRGPTSEEPGAELYASSDSASLSSTPADGFTLAGTTLSEMTAVPWMNPTVGSTLAVADMRTAAFASPLPEGHLLVVSVAAAAGLVMLWVLYHRISRSHALENRTRRDILELVRAEPGLRIGSVATRLQLDFKTVLHHVRILQRHALLQEAGDTQRRLFAAGLHGQQDVFYYTKVVTAAATRRIHEFLLANGEMEMSVIGIRLGLAKSTVSESVSVLRKAGLAEKRRRARTILVRPVLHAAPRNPTLAGEARTPEMVPKVRLE